ncbi:MAG: twin-arginine translocase subunit TatC [Clostridia bacterium]|nr:twin-arginine translocase subunit TatC [Clostridia bacterium]
MSVDNKTTKSKKSEWKSFKEIYSEARDKFREKRRQRQEGQSIVGHLTELRTRLFIIVIAFIVLSLCAFAFVKTITEVMLEMGTEAGFKFVYLSPSEILVANFKVSLIISLVVDLPLILFELWAFAAPALTKKEKIVVSLCLFAGLIFFALGSYFCYAVAMPMMVQFLSNYSNSEIITASISFQNYLNFVVSMILTFGLIFEMPILAMLLSQFGILKPQFMVKARKYAILVIFIVAAIITPPDVVSQILIGVPMIVLYEISILVCRLTYRRKKEKEVEEFGEDIVEET